MKPAKVEVDLLVKAGWVFPVDGVTESIQNGEVAVKDGKVIYVGPTLKNEWNSKKVVEFSDSALLPGFVNCHCHAASTVFRAQTEDGEGGRALYNIVFRGEGLIQDEDWKILARLGVIEMAKAGKGNDEYGYRSEFIRLMEMYEINLAAK